MISNATKGSIPRWIQIIFGIPILGYVYSPFEQIDVRTTPSDLLRTARGGTWWRSAKNAGFIPAFAADVDAVLAKNIAQRT